MHHPQFFVEPQSPLIPHQLLGLSMVLKTHEEFVHIFCKHVEASILHQPPPMPHSFSNRIKTVDKKHFHNDFAYVQLQKNVQHYSAGHFFGVEHTQSRYESAFYQPFLSDWRNYEAWEAAGAVWTPQRAYKIYEQILHEFSEPSIDQGVDEELKDFVARRKTEGGAPTDF